MIALANSNNSNVGGLVRNIINIIYDKPLSIPFLKQPLITSHDSLLRQFTGIFTTGSGSNSQIHISKKDSALQVVIGTQDGFSIYPVSKNQFRSEDMRVDFMKDKNGQLQLFMYRKGEFLGARWASSL